MNPDTPPLENDTGADEQLARALVKILDDKKGEEICLLDLRGRVLFTDFFLIVSGTSDRHARALAEEVDRHAHLHKIRVLGIEGMESAEWILMDLGDVIVHVFQKETRAFYNLEKLWGLPPLPAPMVIPPPADGDVPPSDTDPQ